MLRFFDIAYLFSRIRQVLGRERCEPSISLGNDQEHVVRTKHGEKTAVDLIGISILIISICIKPLLM